MIKNLKIGDKVVIKGEVVNPNGSNLENLVLCAPMSDNFRKSVNSIKTMFDGIPDDTYISCEVWAGKKDDKGKVILPIVYELVKTVTFKLGSLRLIATVSTELDFSIQFANSRGGGGNESQPLTSFATLLNK